MALTALQQRALDLLHSGHTINEVANLLGLQTTDVQNYVQGLTNAATGLPAPADIQHRAVDLAYAGHPVPEIANLTGMSESAVRTALQDTTKVAAQAATPIAGATQTTAPAAGGAAALPATPTGYVTVQINGVSRKIPYY